MQADIVDTFLDNYIALNMEHEHLKSMRNSEVREMGSKSFHISYYYEDVVDVMWDALVERLTDDEVGKYKALMMFGVGKIQVKGNVELDSILSIATQDCIFYILLVDIYREYRSRCIVRVLFLWFILR